MKNVVQVVSPTNSSPVSDVTTGTPNERAAVTVGASSTTVPTRQMRSGCELPLVAAVVVVLVLVVALLGQMLEVTVMFGVGDTDISERGKRENEMFWLGIVISS